MTIAIDVPQAPNIGPGFVVNATSDFIGPAPPNSFMNFQVNNASGARVFYWTVHTEQASQTVRLSVSQFFASLGAPVEGAARQYDTVTLLVEWHSGAGGLLDQGQMSGLVWDALMNLHLVVVNSGAGGGFSASDRQLLQSTENAVQQVYTNSV